MRAVAEAAALDAKWTLWLKNNSDGWELGKMHRLVEMDTVAAFWRALNAMPEKCVSNVSLFLMRDGVVPMWELNGDRLRRGGTWSVVVRGQPWRAVMRDVAMAVVGAVCFDETVVGCCVGVVSATHVIAKIWCERANDSSDGRALASVFDTRTVTPRFKAFA